MILLTPLLVVLIVGLLIWFAHLESKAKKARTRAMSATAYRLGYGFAGGETSYHEGIFAHFTELNRGHSRYAYNAMWGETEGHRIDAYDYHFAVTHSTGKSTTTSHYHRSVVMLQLPAPCPRLTVFEEDLASKIAQFAGYDDIDFESAEFSRRYCVRSENKRFAYNLITPEMMEFLMSRTGLFFEIRERLLVIVNDPQLAPSEYPLFIRRAIDIRNRIPSLAFELN